MSVGRTDACSRQWDDAALPASGTASTASFWVAVEQPGSWPAKAVAALAPQLDAACSAAGGRVLLIRHVGRHPHERPDSSPHATRAAYLAGGLATAAPWLVEVSLEGDAAILALLPFAAMADATPDRVVAGLPSGASIVASPPRALLLVCTNGRRDVCCATRGREVALGAGAARHGLVWECTHTGGHRFSPTAVLLPYGVTYARLSVPSAVAALDAGVSGGIPAALNNDTHDRGCSWLPAPDQTRLSAVRHAIGETSLTALRIDGDLVRHRDGRAWRVEVESQTGPALPASCGKPAVPSTAWRAASLTPC